MKSIFISFDQAFREQIIAVLNNNHHVRGFTLWEQVQGRGSVKGEPHFGSHAWPTLNNTILTVVSDEKVKPILQDLKDLNATSDKMGLRAFVWNVEDSL